MDIIRIENEDYYQIEDFTDEVIYVHGGKPNLYGTHGAEELEKDIINLAESYGIEWNPTKHYQDWLKTKNITVEEDILDYNDWFHGFELGDLEELQEVKNEYGDRLEHETFSFLEQAFHRHGVGDTTSFNEFLNIIGLKLGIVGYSDWSLYIAGKEVDVDFIQNIYEGNYIYSIQHINEHGELLDSLGLVYAPTSTDMKYMIEQYFEVGEEYYIVDSETTMYMDLPKVKEIEEVSYRYEKIEE